MVENYNNIIVVLFFAIDIGLSVLAWKGYFSKIKVKENDVKDAFEKISKFKEGDYTLQFEEINRQLTDNITIKDVWNDFSQTLTRYRVPGEDSDYLYSPVGATEFFRVSAIMKDISNNYWQSFGSIFTGVGILGTFLGLTLGLSGVDLSSSDVSVLKDGIGSLLSGISTAFYTSLFGIFLALVYGYLYKRCRDSLAETLFILSEQIEKMYPRRTVEQWLSVEHSQSVEQTKVMKNLSQDMAENLSELLDTQLSNGFNELCQNLENQMKPTFEKLYAAINSLNDSGASAIAGAVNSKVGNQLDEFSNVLQSIQETMKQSLESSEKTSAAANSMMTETMQKIADLLVQGTESAVQKQQDATERMGEQMKSMVTAFNKSSEDAMNNMFAASNAASSLITASVEANNAKVDDTANKLQNIFEKNNKLFIESHEAFNDMTENIVQLIGKIESSGVKIGQTVDPLLKATESLHEELEQVKSISGQFTEQISSLTKSGEITEKNIHNLTNTVNDAEQKAMSAWKVYHDGLIGMETELGTVLDSITKSIEQYNEQMSKGMSDQLSTFDQSVSNAAGQLKAVVDELNDMVETLAGINQVRK